MYEFYTTLTNHYHCTLTFRTSKTNGDVYDSSRVLIDVEQCFPVKVLYGTCVLSLPRLVTFPEKKNSRDKKNTPETENWKAVISARNNRILFYCVNTVMLRKSLLRKKNCNGIDDYGLKVTVEI